MNSIGAFLGFGFLISEVGLGRWRRSSRTAGTRKLDAGSLRVLWTVITVSITAGIWLGARGIGPRLPQSVPWDWISVVVFAAGTGLRWWSISYLGRYFTVDVAVAADHRIVDTGPYRLVRHPSYSGLLLQFGGLSLMLGNGLSVAVIMVPTFLALLYRIRVEEAALRTSLGELYVDYARRTKRLIPGVY